MKNETKFGLQDKVFLIHNTKPVTWIPCTICDSVGKITVKRRKYKCPECYGYKGHKEWGKEYAWAILGSVTIGQVELRITREERSERYMTCEYGVGSGSVFNVEDLFATKEEAEQECAKRNAIHKGK